MGSLPTAKLLENLFERKRLSALTLRYRLEKHSFGLRVGVERFVSFWKEHGHRRAFRKFRIVQLNATADDPTRSNSQEGSIRRLRRTAARANHRGRDLCNRRGEQPPGRGPGLHLAVVHSRPPSATTDSLLRRDDWKPNSTGDTVEQGGRHATGRDLPR